MSLVADQGKLPVHIPEGAFSFDDEVSKIFDDMAHRSIPNYNTVHAIHTDLILTRYHLANTNCNNFVVLDVGASTGKLFDSICSSLHINRTENPSYFTGIAMDTSGDMLEQLAKKVPWVIRHEHSVSHTFVYDDMEDSVDVINMMYTLQFIPVEERSRAIANCYSMLKPGGLLLMSQKETTPPVLGIDMDRHYHNWRIRNGYTVDEIYKKTLALKRSMWTETQEVTMGRLSLAGFTGLCETSRWMQFSSILGVKPIK